MAFHVRLTKHNLLKIIKIRALPYSTQTEDKHFERHADYLLENADHLQRNFPGVKHNGVILQETHLFMTKTRAQSQSQSPDYTAKALGCLSSDLHTLTWGSQHLKKCKCGSRSCGEYRARGRSRSQARHEVQSSFGAEEGFLPMALNDLHSILLGHDFYGSKENKQDCLSHFLKPVSYTSDDILARTDDRHDTGCGSWSPPNVINHENHDVTVIQQVFSRLNSVAVDATNGDGTVFCKGSDSQSTKEKSRQSGPSKEQLLKVENFFAETLPTFLKKRQDYRIYHKDIIFENNYWGGNVITVGINAYVMQLNKVKILTHLKYAHAQFYVLKITNHPEDGTVRIRWRISGLPQLQTLQFWKFLPWNYRKNRNESSEWHDGFSILTIGSDGFVQKHRVDRVMPDEERQVVKPATKLAIMLGLVPKPSMDGFSSLFMKRSMLGDK